MTTDLISNPFSGPVSTQKSDCDLSSNADSGSYSNSGLDSCSGSPSCSSNSGKSSNADSGSYSNSDLDSCSGSPSCSSNSESDAGLGSDFNLEDIPVILCGLGNSHSDSNPITFPASGSGSKAEYIEPKLQPVAKKRDIREMMPVECVEVEYVQPEVQPEVQPVAKKRFVREMMPASRESGEVESPKSRCGCLIN